MMDIEIISLVALLKVQRTRMAAETFESMEWLLRVILSCHECKGESILV